MPDRIYLDHAATTPMRPEAVAAVAEGMARWANPSSPHAEGRAARAALEEARERIKAALGWDGELIFTSGASETFRLCFDRLGHTDLLPLTVEHNNLHLAALYDDPSELQVDARGVLTEALLLDGLARLRARYPHRENFSPLAAIQQANSETGVIQHVDRLARFVRESGGALLCDASQSAGKLALPDADLIVASSHKLGGPPGVGALLLRDLARLDPTGGQEQGYRAGTENLPGALGFAAALDAGFGWVDEAIRLRARLETALLDLGAEIVAGEADRIPTIGAYRMPGVAAAALLIRFDLAGIAVSAGSACASGSLRPSHVLTAMGWSEAAAREVIRVSFGWTTTEAEVDRFIAVWSDIAREAGVRAA